MLKCPKCNSQIINKQYTDNPSDGYLLTCENNHIEFISVYALENYYDEMED